MRLPDKATILATHNKLLAAYGGAGGVRDEGGLDAALAQVNQIKAYSNDAGDIFALSSALAFSIIKIHRPFVAGNKRVGFAVLFQTLYMNGWYLDVGESVATKTILGVASGDLGENTFADWTRAHCVERE